MHLFSDKGIRTIDRLPRTDGAKEDRHWTRNRESVRKKRNECAQDYSHPNIAVFFCCLDEHERDSVGPSENGIHHLRMHSIMNESTTEGLS